MTPLTYCQESHIHNNKIKELTLNTCSQLPWLGGQAGGGVDGSADGHLGQRPQAETVGVGPAGRSASGPVGENLLLHEAVTDGGGGF